MSYAARPSAPAWMLALYVSCGVGIPCAVAAAATSQAVERVVAFADVHGAHAQLLHLLQVAGVVDEELHWSGGRTHLVSLGDLLDRGDDSRKVMDLLMRLQPEAEAAGGRVHVVLGNHEAMNLLGDLRYVTPGEFAAYAGDEREGMREQARSEWLGRNAGQSAGDFDQRFPPGWFGQRAALAPEGVYGRWLLALPVAVVIGDTLFMHGGPSRALHGLSLPDINLRYRTALSDYLIALTPIAAAGLVHIEDAFADRAELAQGRLEVLSASDSSAPLVDALQAFVAADGNPMLGLDGPNWYRGAALCNECAESDVLRPILEQLQVRRLVIGHTVARDLRVASRFDGVVIKLDAGMNVERYGGHPAALVLEHGEARVLYADGDGKAAPVPGEPLYVTSATLDDEQVAALIADADATVVGPRGPGLFDLKLERAGQSTAAVFVAAKPEAVQRELAAYRLDRLLGLGLVPPTAARELQDRRGYVQARPERWVTQSDVTQQALSGGGWCALEPQLQLVYTFDALIGNDGRTADRLVFDAEEWTVRLTGHDRAFGTGTALPDYLKAQPPAPGAEMRRRLAALDEAAIAGTLGELLSVRQRAALLERRDRLLAAP